MSPYPGPEAIAGRAVALRPVPAGAACAVGIAETCRNFTTPRSGLAHPGTSEARSGTFVIDEIFMRRGDGPLGTGARRNGAGMVVRVVSKHQWTTAELGLLGVKKRRRCAPSSGPAPADTRRAAAWGPVPTARRTPGRRRPPRAVPTRSAGLWSRRRPMQHDDRHGVAEVCRGRGRSKIQGSFLTLAYRGTWLIIDVSYGTGELTFACIPWISEPGCGRPG